MQRQDETRLEAIDQALDGEIHGLGLDSATRLTITRLRVMATTAGHSRTASTQRQQLPASAQPGSPSRRGHRHSPRLISMVATLAIFVLIGAIASFVTTGKNKPSGGVVAPSMMAQAASTPAIGCDINSNVPFPRYPWNMLSLLRQTSYWIPAPFDLSRYIQVVKRSDLPEGTTLDHQTYVAVENALQARIDCSRSGTAEWDQVRVTSDGEGVNGRLTFELAIRPSLIRMEQLDTGLVGILINRDLYGFGVSEYQLYSNLGGTWALIDFVLVADDQTIEHPLITTIPTSVNLRLWYMWPDSFSLASDEPVSITFSNDLADSVIVRIDALEVWEYLEPGDSITVPFRGKSGVYSVEVLQPGVAMPIRSSALTLVPVSEAATPVS